MAMARTIARGAASPGCLVSSVRCALASYPVKVSAPTSRPSSAA